MTGILNLFFKKHPGKHKETSPIENQFNAGFHGYEELSYRLMRQFFYDVHGWR